MPNTYNPDMTETEMIQAPVEAAVVKAEPVPAEVAKHDEHSARVESVARLLDAGYKQTSTLKLTTEEDAALGAPFPDSAVEVRPHDGLCWIPHIHISRRLSTVLGRGQWALITRRYWADGERGMVYADCVMLIRGAVLGESIGAQAYHASNPKMNLSDAVEGAQSEALRRIAGKRLNCGDQVWDPDYCRKWIEKYATRGRDGKWMRRGSAEPQPAAPAPAPQPAPAPAPETPEHRRDRWVSAMVAAGGGNPSYGQDYAVEMGIMPAGQPLNHWPIDKVPATKRAADEILVAIRNMAGVMPIPTPDAAPETPKQEAKPSTPATPGDHDEPWRSFPVPFGKHAGIKLGDLPKNTLYGFALNFKVENEYNGKPRSSDRIARDQAFRDALDEAGRHYGFTKPDDDQGEVVP